MRYSSTPTETQISNILRVWKRATAAERGDGFVWYERAHAAAVAISDDSGHELSVVAAVISAISPNNSWALNLDQARALCLAVSDEERNDCSASTYDGGDKARAILSGDMLAACGTKASGAAFTYTAPKTRAFFQLIADPTLTDVVVVDGHAWCIAQGERRPLEDVPSLTGNKYRQIANAYIVAAQRLGVPAHVVQATTWLAWRRIHETTRTIDPTL